MKRIIIVFFTLFLVVPLVAQEGDSKSKGLQKGFNRVVEIGGGVKFEKLSDILLITEICQSHGVCQIKV